MGAPYRRLLKTQDDLPAPCPRFRCLSVDSTGFHPYLHTIVPSGPGKGMLGPSALVSAHCARRVSRQATRVWDRIWNWTFEPCWTPHK
jgi:hypothetical protein